MTHPEAVDRISKGGMCQEADWSVYSVSSYQDALDQNPRRWGLFIMVIRRNEQAARKIIKNERALPMRKGRVFSGNDQSDGGSKLARVKKPP